MGNQTEQHHHMKRAKNEKSVLKYFELRYIVSDTRG